MKMNVTSIALGITLGSALWGIAPAVQAHQCTVSDVAGTYVYTSTGTIVSPPVGPLTAVGRATWTESGTLSGAQTTSIAGNLVEETFQGTFTVNPDCTGLATVHVYHGTTLARTTQLKLVWDLRHAEGRAIFLSPGTSISIDARKVADD